MHKQRLILNRAFQEAEDGFYQLSPFGEFPGSLEVGGKAVPVVQVLTRDHLEPIYNRLVEQAQNANWSGLLGDREHWSLSDDKATDALAWFREFQLRDDGIYAKPKKTELGERLVNGGTLRMISPVFDVEPEDGGEIKNGSRMIPTGIDSIGFTNRPRLGKFMKPVSNRDGQTENQNQPEETMKLVNKALNLPDAADETSVVAEIEKLKNKAGQATSLQTQLEAEKLKVANMEKAQLEKEADVFIETNKDRIVNTDEARADMKKLYVENKSAAETAVRVMAPAKQEAPRTINRSTRQPASPTDGGSGDSAKAARIKNRAQSLTDSAKSRGEKLDWPDAWAQAKSEVENG